MNESELFLAGGKPTGIWFCAECRRVSQSQEVAARCCAPYICDMCQCEIPYKTYRTRCPDCIEIARKAKNLALMEKAEEIPWGNSFNDMLFWCDESHGNEGYGDMDEIMEGVRDNLQDWEPEDRPDHVVERMTKTRPLVNVHLDCLLDGISEDSYEDFDCSDLHGIKELKEALEAFNAANTDFKMYVDERKQYVRIPVSELEFYDE